MNVCVCVCVCLLKHYYPPPKKRENVQERVRRVRVYVGRALEESTKFVGVKTEAMGELHHVRLAPVRTVWAYVPRIVSRHPFESFL